MVSMLMSALALCLTFAPATRAGDVEGGPVSETVLPPLWQAGAPTPPHRIARAMTALAPFVTSSLPEDAAWEGFVTPANRGTSSIFVEFQGKLVLSSDGSADSVITHGLVTWDGTKFEALPALPGYLGALGVWNDHLLAATYAYNPSRYWIVQLDGAVWDTLGEPDDLVSKFGEFQSHLIAGGRFTAVDGVACARVAAFDGTAWSNAGTGISGTGVTGLTVHQGKLVAGGSITPAQGVVSLDALGGAWQPVGTGFGGGVKDVLSDGVELYASGAIYNSAGTTSLGAFMHWNGTTWNGTGSPTNWGTSSVYMTRWNGKVVVGVIAPGSAVGRLAQWDGVTLSPIPGDSLNGAALGVGTWGTKLVATGPIISNGSVPVPSIVTFDGAQWGTVQEAWGPGMYGIPSGYFTDMRTWGGKLIVSGVFRVFADGDHWVNLAAITAWDGAHWTPLGNGLDGYSIFLGEYAGDLIAFGFNLVARGPSEHVVRLNGTSWSGFGTNSPDYLTSAAEFQAQLYVGSDVSGLWSWNGSTWAAVPGLEGQSIEALGAVGGRLVVGGYFPQAGAAASPNVAFWDGSAWTAAGAGVNDAVSTVVEWLGQPVIGGVFTASGATPLPGAATWDGSQWQPMGTRAVAVARLAVLEGELFATGTFRLPDESVVETIAHWTGTDWHVLGSGGGDDPNPFPNPFASFGGYLYQGGAGIVHGHASHGLSRVPLSAVLDVPRAGPHPSTLALAASPNPSRGLTAFAFTLPSAGHARLTVVDVAGRVVATLADGPFEAGEHQARWAAPAPAGVYFARLDAPRGASRVTRVVRFE